MLPCAKAPALARTKESELRQSGSMKETKTVETEPGGNAYGAHCSLALWLSPMASLPS
jgi:hypothetical protein